MKLGILVNTDRHLDHVVGIAKAALGRRHEVAIFVTGGGTKLLGTPEFAGLCAAPGVSMSFCDLVAKKTEVATESLPPEIVCGSQYHNAAMNHDADRVIVL